MKNKLNIPKKIKDEIYNKYISGISMRKLEKQYPYSFTFIQKLINSYEFENNIKKNYPEKDGYYIVAICKKTDKIIEDYKNLSGAITNHLKKIYPELQIPSNYKRKSIEYKTGKFWYDDYFIFNYNEIKQTKKCFYCNWETTDIYNKSGAYKNHLKNIHNISLNEHLQNNPQDNDYFKEIPIKNGVKCKICGKELKLINNTHLKKHNITLSEYKLKYGDIDILSENTKNKMIKAGYNNNKFVKKSKTSKSENEIKNFLEKNDIIVEQSKRKYLNGLEIDLYLPEYSIGIEFNGNLYHTEKYGKKNFNYHLNKTKEALKNNIYLYHIHEDEWEEKTEIVKYKLLYILKKCDNIIHARKCVIKEIKDKKNKSFFLNNNHIQGDVRSGIYIGSYYNDELVALMCFDNKRNMNKSKNHNNNTYELTRFVVKNNYVINGIASKLLKYFINNYNPDIIISFADRRWTPNQNNNLYTKLGFNCINILKPDYKYYNRKLHRSGRLHKFNFGKNKLKNKYPDNYDKNKTEWEIMQEVGFDRIWDCGKFKYILNIKKED